MTTNSDFKPDKEDENMELGEKISEDRDEKVELKKELGMWQGVSVIVGSMIGSGIFITPGDVLRTCGSVPVALIIWAISGIIVLFGSTMYIELGSMMPKAGGDYEYLLQVMGPAPAFLFAWTRVVLTAPSSLAVAALAFGNYLLTPIFPCNIPQPPRYLLGILALLVFTYLNCRSVKIAAKIQLFFAIGKFVALSGVLVAGIYAFAIGGAKYYKEGFKGTSTNALDIIISFYSAIFAFTGWNFLNFVVEELREPEKNLPRCAYIGIGAVTAFYILVNVAYFAMIPVAEAVASPALAVTALGALHPALGTVVAVLVSLSVFGFLNNVLFASTRVGFSAARNHHMPVVMAYVTINFLTPLVAVIVIAIFTVIYISIGNLTVIVYMNSFGEAFFYCVTSLAYFYLRWKRKDAPRSYKAFIVFPVVFFIGMTFVTVISLVKEPAACAGALALILGGLIFYFVFCVLIKPPSVRKVTNQVILCIQKASYSVMQEE